MNLVPASFPTLCAQLAEIKAISLILFEAKVNRLVHVKRWRVSIDDPPGSNDYHDFAEGNLTNKLTGTVGNPYEVKFHCFSPELAGVMEGLYKASYGLTVKSLVVEPAPVSEMEASGRNRVPPPILVFAPPRIQPLQG